MAAAEGVGSRRTSLQQEPPPGWLLLRLAPADPASQVVKPEPPRGKQVEAFAEGSDRLRQPRDYAIPRTTSGRPLSLPMNETTISTLQTLHAAGDLKSPYRVDVIFCEMFHPFRVFRPERAQTALVAALMRSAFRGAGRDDLSSWVSGSSP